ncbi:type II secretion system protein GspF [Pseudomonas brenneri]|uniref:Type II secretion system protein F (GspF) n=1 Tax=Pseudomonas brenneri TaxID=129817 RepID=A0A5B2UIA7_9PSED|nr:type II secretion system F family protein [Pseudomonas brenneri]KAA2226160.1 type II secretion system protein GspF [Pseudomonas brenneri]TWR71616.1 type II secretion system protein GspF [Pseudomonas brenneri]GGL65112.1 type II secretion system protein GspF [Pseudomonas brenneri]SDV08955.1 type II secretion system protein F (GspF) [Pseudomonas brenneri]
MTLFRYHVLDRDGRRSSGQLQAATRDKAITQLQAYGFLILEIRPAVATVFFAPPFRKTEVSAAEVVRFTQQLATLLDAGQPLESALALLARQSAKRPLRELIGRLQECVKGGGSLSIAIASESSIFSNFYLSLVRAGEAAGMLAQTLVQLSHYLERAQSQRGELVSALIYPAFLVAGVLGSLVLLMTYVVPQFVPIFKDLNVALPLITELILFTGESLVQWGVYLVLLVILGSGWIVRSLRDPSRRLRLDAYLLRRRVLGVFLQGVETARFALTLGTLLERKVTLLSGMTIARQVASNRAFQGGLERAAMQTKEGVSLSDALEQTGVFPELAVQMIRVGEQTGKMSGLLLKLADIYDQETQRTLKRFMAALVPILTLVMTALVAVIMLAIMLPLMSLTSNI